MYLLKVILKKLIPSWPQLFFILGFVAYALLHNNSYSTDAQLLEVVFMSGIILKCKLFPSYHNIKNPSKIYIHLF